MMQILKDFLAGVALGLLLVLIFGLGGCSTTKDVQVPVPVSCVKSEPDTPTYRYSPPYDNVFDAVRDLLGDREVSGAYEKQLKEVVKACK